MHRDARADDIRADGRGDITMDIDARFDARTDDKRFDAIQERNGFFENGIERRNDGRKDRALDPCAFDTARTPRILLAYSSSVRLISVEIRATNVSLFCSNPPSMIFVLPISSVRIIVSHPFAVNFFAYLYRIAYFSEKSKKFCQKDTEINFIKPKKGSLV